MPKDFSDVVEVFEHRVKEIEDACWANEPSLLFLTGDKSLLRVVNKQRKRDGEEPLEYVPNFREQLAVTRAYKERKSSKPYHYYNLRAYIFQNYETVIAWGMEADDLLAVYQNPDLSTIICSRDKDLRQVEGMTYSWECGQQAAFGPVAVDSIGTLELPKPNKVVGTGLKFFYAQAITGDPVDTIPGLPRGGPALAYKTLKDCETEEEMYDAVAALYEDKWGEEWEERMLEQLRLLYMVRELDEEGKPIMYVPPKER